MGDERLPQFYKIWKVITTGMIVPLDDRILCDIFLERIRPSKKLASDIHEFDRMRDDDANKNLRRLTDSIDRLLQRERMLSARALQTKRIQSGASLTTDQSHGNSNAAPAQGKDKGKGKGKTKGKGKEKGKGKAPDEGKGVGYIPSTSGICFSFARLGICDKDGCTFQHVSGGQLRKALGGNAGQIPKQTATRQQSKGSERGASQGKKGKGKGKGKGKPDALPSKEDDGKIHLNALPSAVRRQLSRPRWCSDYLKGCCNKDPCQFPHHSEQVVAEIKEKDSAY